MLKVGRDRMLATSSQCEGFGSFNHALQIWSVLVIERPSGSCSQLLTRLYHPCEALHCLGACSLKPIVVENHCDRTLKSRSSLIMRIRYRGFNRARLFILDLHRDTFQVFEAR